MNTWTYRALMTLCVTSIVLSLYSAYTKKPTQELCLNNMVMVKGVDMYVQKGLWPTHCVAISKD
jgi:hypothetical protein